MFLITAARRNLASVPVVCRNQSQLSAVEHQMGDVSLEPPSEEEEESEDCDEEEDEDWVWRSAGAHLTKRHNSQVRLWGPLLMSACAVS